MSVDQASDKVCIVVGAGHAGSALAVQLRKEGWTGRIVLIGAETALPYHRPPLSKAVLAGEKTLDAIALRPLSHYSASGVELRRGECVVAIDRQAQTVLLAGGESLRYDALALCTGTVARTLPRAAELQGVHTLRVAEDAERIRAAAANVRRAVIVGGGYIGLEVAAVLRTQGLEVTVLEAGSRLLARVAHPVVSDFFARLHARHGVTIQTGVAGVELLGESAVSGVREASGHVHPADLVIVGIGVVPELALARAAGLDVDNGIVVDAYACTSDSHIFAAGDCTWHPSARYGRRLRLESVQNALDQARVAAANICGKQVLYDALPWFWSDQYSIKLQSAGLLLEHESVVLRGDPQTAGDEGFCVFHLRGETMVAADCINRAREFIACKRLIGERLRVNVKALADEHCGLDTFELREDVL
jgi:3-phenylpropionate/trans-cinnamate dioxygenase ferredoxin reductase subunit